MKRIIISTLLVNTLLLANSTNQNWTIVICNTKNIENANAFIDKHIKKQIKDIFIIKSAKTYITTYGSYDSYEEAKVAQKNIPKYLNKLGAYVLKTKYDLATPNKAVNIISMRQKELPKTIQTPTQQPTLNTATITKKIPVKKSIVKPIKIEEIKKPKNKEATVYKEQINRDKVSSNNYTISASLKYTQLKQSGDFTFGTISSKVDTEELGIDKTNVLIPTIEIDTSSHKFLASYLSNKTNQSKVISNNITLDNYTYLKNSNIKTDISTKWLKGGYRYNYKDLYAGVDIHNYKSDISISDTLNTTNIKINYIFPTVSLDMKHPLNNYSFNYGTSYGANGGINYLDYYINLAILFGETDSSVISLGYQAQQLDIKETIYTGSTKYQGINLEYKNTF